MGALRLFNTQIAGQIAWLLPFALIGVLVRRGSAGCVPYSYATPRRRHGQGGGASSQPCLPSARYRGRRRSSGVCGSSPKSWGFWRCEWIPPLLSQHSRAVACRARRNRSCNSVARTPRRAQKRGNHLCRRSRCDRNSARSHPARLSGIPTVDCTDNCWGLHRGGGRVAGSAIATGCVLRVAQRSTCRRGVATLLLAPIVWAALPVSRGDNSGLLPYARQHRRHETGPLSR